MTISIEPTPDGKFEDFRAPGIAGRRIATGKLPVQVTTLSPVHTVVVVDGLDITKNVNVVSYRHKVGEIGVLTVDVPAIQGAGLEAEAEIALGPNMVSLLGRLGWAPPPKPRKLGLIGESGPEMVDTTGLEYKGVSIPGRGFMAAGTPDHDAWLAERDRAAGAS